MSFGPWLSPSPARSLGPLCTLNFKLPTGQTCESLPVGWLVGWNEEENEAEAEEEEEKEDASVEQNN